MTVAPIKRAWMGATVGYLFGRNMAFRHAPSVANALMRVTNVGGRGRGREGEDGARYFEAVVQDYERVAAHVGLTAEGESLFRDRTVLELGPGNTRAVGLLALLRGAKAFDGWDRFDVQARDDARLRPVYEPLLARAGVDGGYAKAMELLRDVRVHGEVASVRAANRRYDLVISRAVLEHVRDLDDLHASLREVTTDDAVLVHKVDLRSHGFEWDHELDFLLFDESTWRGLTTHIGEPNRARAPGYLEVARRHGFVPVHVSASRTIPAARAAALRPHLASPYREMSPAVLSVLGIWLVLVREGHPLARAAAAVDVERIPDAPSGLAAF